MKLNPQCGSIDPPPSTRLQPEWSSRDRSAPSPGPDDPFPDRPGATRAGEPAHAPRRRRRRRLRARARRLFDGRSGQAHPGRRQVVQRQDPELGELGRLHRRGRQRRLPDARGVHRGDRHRGQLRGRRRRQQHLLRQGEGPARARPGHRRRHRLPHRLDGRPMDPLRLHAGARPRQHPEPREPHAGTAEPRLRPRSQVLGAVAGRLRGHLLEQGGDPGRPRLGRGPLELRAQGPRRRALRDAGHDGPDHAPERRRHLGRVGRRRVHRGDRDPRASRSRTGRSATSRATRTSRTSRARTPSRRSAGRATSR